MKPSQLQPHKLAEFARNNGQRDIGKCMRPAFHAPPEVVQRIEMRYPGMLHDEKEFIRWFNSSASEYYNRFKTVKRI
jgi:hypothetical protein